MNRRLWICDQTGEKFNTREEVAQKYPDIKNAGGGYLYQTEGPLTFTYRRIVEMPWVVYTDSGLQKGEFKTATSAMKHFKSLTFERVLNHYEAIDRYKRRIYLKQLAPYTSMDIVIE